jgi:outer membrane protein
MNPASRNTVCALLLLLPALVFGGQEVARIPFVNAPDGTAGLGGSLRIGTDPYFSNDEKDDVLDLIPLYLFEGDYLFAQGTYGGIHLVDTENFEFNVIGQFRFQHLSPKRDSFYEGLTRRKRSFDGGVSLVGKSQWGTVKLDWLTDALNRHKGEELSLSYRYNFVHGRWSFSPYVNWAWQDKNLTNYYYGVSAAEARPDRPEYTTTDGAYFGYGLNTSYQASERILLFANVGFEGLPSTVQNSPLVEEPMTSAALLGGTFMFGSIERAEAPLERQKEWSWRLNYGYQAHGNVVGQIDQGDFRESMLAKTDIGGLTVSRLMLDGPRIDYYGRLAMFRHFEDPYQEDFNSYSAYVMAVGKGYSRWTDEELFRWGFGFGMNYAESVPIAETIKQSRKGDNTSHFLNYLELSLDMPLRRVTKAKLFRNCYAGVTVVHRSGIFGTAKILGDVAGGSDWITAHLECIQQ